VVCCFGFVANPGGSVVVYCFGFVADSDGSMVLVVVLSICFFLGLWQIQRVCGGLLFWVFGGDCGRFGWWCG